MKQCLVDSCNCNVFGKGYCKRHQYLRTDKPKKSNNRAVEPRSPLQTYKVSTSVKQELITNKKELLFSFGFKTQKELFDFVWNTREHKCALSGRDLNNVSDNYKHWCCAHILPKKLYPYFKYFAGNILLLHPEVHTMVDNFTEDLRDKNPDVNFDLWFLMQERQKEKYKLFLKDNLL